MKNMKEEPYPTVEQDRSFMHQDHPWQSARNRFDSEVLPKLQAMGNFIGDQARAGNELAKNVINVYTMLHSSFDPLTLIRLEVALNEYDSAMIL